MCDDYQLEVCVVLPFIDNTIRRKQDFVVSGQRIWIINNTWLHLAPGPAASIKYQEKKGTHSTRLAASASIFSTSRAFVGSSRARIPQFCPKESDSASRMIIEASIFWPALQRPRMSISTWSLVITTCEMFIVKIDKYDCSLGCGLHVRDSCRSV